MYVCASKWARRLVSPPSIVVVKVFNGYHIVNPSSWEKVVVIENVSMGERNVLQASDDQEIVDGKKAVDLSRSQKGDPESREALSLVNQLMHRE